MLYCSQTLFWGNHDLGTDLDMNRVSKKADDREQSCKIKSRMVGKYWHYYISRHRIDFQEGQDMQDVTNSLVCVCATNMWLEVPVDACVAGQEPITAIYGLLSRPVVTKRLSGSCNNGLSYCEHAARASIGTLTHICLAHVHAQLFACSVSPLYWNSRKLSRPHPQPMRS